jgi:hypothetical protein
VYTNSENTLISQLAEQLAGRQRLRAEAIEMERLHVREF